MIRSYCEKTVNSEFRKYSHLSCLRLVSLMSGASTASPHTALQAPEHWGSPRVPGQHRLPFYTFHQLDDIKDLYILLLPYPPWQWCVSRYIRLHSFLEKIIKFVMNTFFHNTEIRNARDVTALIKTTKIIANYQKLIIYFRKFGFMVLKHK